MPSATFQKSNNLRLALGTKLHDLDTDTIKFALTNTAPLATTISFNSGAGQAHESPASTSGYTAGGEIGDVTYVETPAGIGTLSLNTPIVYTGGVSGIGPFRYIIVYNFSAGSNNVLGWFDYGFPGISLLASTETLTVNSGVFCTLD